MTEEEIEKDNEMRSLVRKIVYAHAEDYAKGRHCTECSEISIWR